MKIEESLSKDESRKKSKGKNVKNSDKRVEARVLQVTRA